MCAFVFNAVLDGIGDAKLVGCINKDKNGDANHSQNNTNHNDLTNTMIFITNITNINKMPKTMITKDNTSIDNNSSTKTRQYKQ